MMRNDVEMMGTMMQRGTYITKGGYTAHVWDYGKNMLDESCWRGTIKGQGFCTWDDDGKDLAGYESCDLVLEDAVEATHQEGE